MTISKIIFLVAALSTPALSTEVSQALRQALHSSDWQQRAAAAESLANDPDRPAEGDTELATLLAREDSIVLAALKEGHGAAEKYGEYYAEYVAALSDAVVKIAEKNPERSDVWPALLDAPYNPDSAFVRWLGTHADKAIGLLLPKAGSPDPLTRGGAVETLGQILGVEQRQSAHKISTAQMRAVEIVVRSALRDKDAFVRGSAMSAVAAFGTREDIPMLERAASDAESGFHAGYALMELRHRLDNATHTPAAIKP